MIQLEWQRRIIKDWSQRELSLRSHVGQNWISLTESGRYVPSFNQLCKLANSLGWDDEPEKLLEKVSGTRSVDERLKCDKPFSKEQERFIRDVVASEVLNQHSYFYDLTETLKRRGFGEEKEQKPCC